MAGIADALTQNVLAGPQGFAHLAQLIPPCKGDGDLQIALAEAHQSLPDLAAGLHNALYDLKGYGQNHQGGNHHHGENHAQANIGGHILFRNDLTLLILQEGSQVVSGGRGFVQHGGTVADDPLRGLLLVCTCNGANRFGLLLPCLQSAHEIVEEGAVLLVLGIGILQLLDVHVHFLKLGIDLGQAVLIAGNDHIAQASCGNIIVNTALRNQLVGLDVVIKDVLVRLFLHVHHHKRRNDD